MLGTSPMTDATGFPDAVDANRSARLCEQQLRELQAGVRHRGRYTPYIDNGSVPPDYRLSVSSHQTGSHVFNTTRELYESAPLGGHGREGL